MVGEQDEGHDWGLMVDMVVDMVMDIVMDMMGDMMVDIVMDMVGDIVGLQPLCGNVRPYSMKHYNQIRLFSRVSAYTL